MCAGTVSAAAGLRVAIPQKRRQAGIRPVPWHILLHSTVTCSPVSLFTTSVLLLLLGTPLCFETAASSTASFTVISFAFLFSPFPYSAAQKQLKSSFPYLISNVRSLCFNEPSLDPLEDRILATTKHQPAENQD